MFLFKNKKLNSLINSFKSWEDNTKKYNQNETEGIFSLIFFVFKCKTIKLILAFEALEDWSSECNNVAIQVCLFVVFVLLNNN
jgi:hypothetical protein